MIPEEMCSGSCGGKRENCPCPMACGWPEVKKVEVKMLKYFAGAVTCIGLIIFCAVVLTWP